MSFYNNHEMTMEDFTSLLKEFGVSDTGEKDRDDEIVGHIKTKDSFGDNIEFQKGCFLELFDFHFLFLKFNLNLFFIDYFANDDFF